MLLVATAYADLAVAQRAEKQLEGKREQRRGCVSGDERERQAEGLAAYIVPTARQCGMQAWYASLSPHAPCVAWVGRTGLVAGMQASRHAGDSLGSMVIAYSISQPCSAAKIQYSQQLVGCSGTKHNCQSLATAPSQ